jgi:HD-GYP domain-containing protein (c-di-GMP phosphodiesterase class II)
MLVKKPTPLVVYVFGLCIVAGAMLALARVEVPADASRFRNALVALVGLGFLAEFFALRLRHGTATSAVSFVPYLASILLLGPSWAMIVAGITELVAETVVRRKPLIKVLHNTAKEIVAIGAAGFLYLSLGSEVPSFLVFTIDIPAFIASTVLYFVISNGAVATAVMLSTGIGFGESWSQIVGRGGLLQDVLSSSLSPLLAFLLVDLELLGLMLVIVPLFFVRHALHANLKLEQTNRELLELMVKSIEARDPYTSGHSVRVASYAKALARAMNLPAREIEQIETAALLHDVGKIYEEFAPILRKEARLNLEERQLIRTHPIRSADLVSTITSLRGYVQSCVRAHHESFDGGGYPEGLAAEEIPMGARIIMIADTADAMMTDRPYRQARSYEEVVAELESLAGVQFDPRVVEAFKQSTAIRRLIEERRQMLAQTDTDIVERHVSLAAR